MKELYNFYLKTFNVPEEISVDLIYCIMDGIDLITVTQNHRIESNSSSFVIKRLCTEIVMKITRQARLKLCTLPFVRR